MGVGIFAGVACARSRRRRRLIADAPADCPRGLAAGGWLAGWFCTGTSAPGTAAGTAPLFNWLSSAAIRCSWSALSWQIGLEILQAISIFFRLAKKVGHLPLQRIQSLIEGGDRRLGGGGIVGEAGGVGRPALGKDLPLDLLHLPFEPIDPRFGRWRLALRQGARAGTSGSAAPAARIDHETAFTSSFPHFRYRGDCARLRLSRR